MAVANKQWTLPWYKFSKNKQKRVPGPLYSLWLAHWWPPLLHSPPFLANKQEYYNSFNELHF